LAVAAGLIAVALTASRGLPGQSHYELKAEFADARGITKGSDVVIAGHHVGRVLGGSTRDGHAVLDLQLDSDAGPLPTDTAARIRYVSLLGALTVELTPGRASRMLAGGATIAVAQTSTAVQLPDVLGAFDSERRSELRTTLRVLGAGMLGRGAQLNETLTDAPRLLTDIRSVADATLARAGAAERLFPSIKRLATASEPVRHAIATGFAPEARVVGAIASRQADLDAVLRVAPPSLSGIRTGLAETDPLLHQARRLARAASAALTPAPGAFRQATALLREARAPLARLRPVLVRADAAVPPVLRLARVVNPLIPRIRDGLRSPLPLLDQVTARACDILNFGRNWRSMLGYSPAGTSSGLGALNLYRVTVQAVGKGEVAGGQTGRSAAGGYPAPCTSLQERLP
jgi:phospholipid/cholesterol/gamma-HCH transport system substrate-binding protein